MVTRTYRSAQTAFPLGRYVVRCCSALACMSALLLLCVWSYGVVRHGECFPLRRLTSEPDVSRGHPLVWLSRVGPLGDSRSLVLSISRQKYGMFLPSLERTSYLINEEIPGQTPLLSDREKYVAALFAERSIPEDIAVALARDNIVRWHANVFACTGDVCVVVCVMWSLWTSVRHLRRERGPDSAP